MSCNLTLGRQEPCMDTIGGLQNVYFVDNGDLGTVTLGTSDEITNMTGDSSNNLTAYKYELRGGSSFEQTINANRENGTHFFEQTLNLQLKKLTKEDNKELKLLIAARPHVVVEDHSGNCMMMGLEFGANVSGGSIVSGTAMGDFQGYTLTFTALEKKPAAFMDVNADVTETGYPFSEFAGLTGSITIEEGSNT